MNASAISGEYLSAASFLGVAGLVLLRGADMLWYPVGWTAGYLLLLVFVAAPLRRSRRLHAAGLRRVPPGVARRPRVASALVVLIGVLYLVPQFQGAGLTLRTLTGAPDLGGRGGRRAGRAVNVVSGGMRTITIAQAFQYWLKLCGAAAAAGFCWSGSDRRAGPAPGGLDVDRLGRAHAGAITPAT